MVGDFTPDGRSFLCGRFAAADKLGDVMLVDLDGDNSQRVFLGGPGDENYPRLSPGRRRARPAPGVGNPTEV